MSAAPFAGDAEAAAAAILRVVPVGTPAPEAAAALRTRGFICEVLLGNGNADAVPAPTTVIESFERRVEMGTAFGDSALLRGQRLHCERLDGPASGCQGNRQWWMYLSLEDGRVAGVAVSSLTFDP